MNNKEAIAELVEWNKENIHDPIVGIFQDERMGEAIDIIVPLASRMAMYEWWWGLEQDDEEALGIDIDWAVLPLSPTDEARVMKAWKENT